MSQRISHNAVLRGWQEVSNQLASAAEQAHPIAKVAALRKIKKRFQRAFNKAVKEEGLESAKGPLLKACRQAFFQYVDNQLGLIEKLYQETSGADAGLPAMAILKGIWGGVPQFNVPLETSADSDAHVDVLVFQADKIGDIRPQKVVNFKFAQKQMLKGVPLDIAELELASQAVARQCGSAPGLAVLFYLSPRGCTNVLHFPTLEQGAADHGGDNKPGLDDEVKPQVGSNQPREYIAAVPDNQKGVSSADEADVPGEATPPSEEPVENGGTGEPKETPDDDAGESRYEWVGVIVQNPTKPMRQGRSAPKSAIRVQGWLYGRHCDQAVDGRFFVAQHASFTPDNPEAVPEAHRRRVLIQLCDWDDWSQNVAHEMLDERVDKHFTSCVFTMVQFLDPDTRGSTQALPVHGLGMDHYKIRNPTPDEYTQVMNLPTKGVPLGFYIPEVGYPWQRIPVYFPVGRPEEEQVFFTPTFYVGRPSSGKTNALKAHAAAAINHDGYGGNKAPAFVFFDFEGQFADLAKANPGDGGNVISQEATDGAGDDAGDWASLGLRPIDPARVTILSVKTPAGPVSFSFEQLLSGTVQEQVNRVKLFLRDMPAATEHVFDAIAGHILPALPRPRYYHQFRAQFERELAASTLGITRTLNVAQRNALKATLAGAGTFFDQPGVPFSLRHMLQPGRVLVFDLDDLPKEKVILYVLACLQRLKFDEKLAVPAIVVIDEAHEVFKKATGSAGEVRFLNLIAKFLAELASRGRKYHLGLWLASQRPQDLHRDVNAVIVNHYILGLNPEHRRWLAAAIGSTKAVDAALKLEPGYALFRSAQFRKGTALLLRLPRAPNVHHTFI